MIYYKTKDELMIMREAGRRLAQTFEYISNFVKVGVNAAYLDQLICEFIKSNKKTNSSIFAI